MKANLADLRLDAKGESERMNEVDVRRAGVGLILTVLTLVGVPFLLRLSLLETRGFNPDELEHLHWSWCVGAGLLPYRDYFDHHTPWLHFFLSRFLSFYDVERIGDDAIVFILMARRWMWLFTGTVLTLTFCLGKIWRDWRSGLVATLLLSNNAFFLSKSLEIRPAVPAAGLLVGAILLALVAVRRANARTPGAGWRFLASGLSLGAATMFTQKVLLVGPGFALVTLWFLLDGRLPLSRAERFRLAGLQVAGYVLPVAMTLGYFAWHGALWHFIDSNLIVNTRWPGLGAWGFLVELVRQDAIFVLLWGGGLSNTGASDVPTRIGQAWRAGSGAQHFFSMGHPSAPHRDVVPTLSAHLANYVALCGMGSGDTG